MPETQRPHQGGRPACLGSSSELPSTKHPAVQGGGVDAGQRTRNWDAPSASIPKTDLSASSGPLCSSPREGVSGRPGLETRRPTSALQIAIDRSCCFSYGFFTLFWCFFFEMHFETVRPQGVLCGEEAPGTTKMKLSAP